VAAVSFAAFVTLLSLLSGFLLGVALTRWGQAGSAKGDEKPTPDPPLVERYRASSRALAERTFLGGAQIALGAPLAPTGIERHLEKGARVLHVTSGEIAAFAGRAFMEGALGIRAALGRCSGIDDGVLDEAVAAALEEVAK
jgi:hypothetical protein